ncbi:MAG: V-type ATP synthase subunit A [Candidatus Woesearchaeota archaeon]
MKQGRITNISGPVIHADIQGAINDVVLVGEEELLGEIIEVREETTIIQVYEETTMLRPGEKITNTQEALSVELGPGILSSVYDGTQRPLDVLKEQQGIFIARGSRAAALNQEKKWHFTPLREEGEEILAGERIGWVQENETIKHYILAPPGTKGKLTSINEGDYTVEEPIAQVGEETITMKQRWPVRIPRPYKKRERTTKPLISGTRVLDFLYPVAKGGAAAIPGPFGAGKTVSQQQFAKWSDAEIIVYIGCGERGNEMTEVLREFPHLEDPKSGNPLMNRTVLIANTSNMPVAAREASIYTGITIAEYFRDQGYSVALMADSTSRWAEAMREISGRLEELPGEEGYPAYLSKKLAEFYERAGIVETLNNDIGSVTIVGAVSPAGGDFSEPVTQNTLRLTRSFWALDANLADKRHFPSINWLKSYSLYTTILDEWFDKNINENWSKYRKEAAQLLQEESELQEIVQLVGVDALPKKEQVTLFIAKLIREDYLQQNAFHEEDTFCPAQKSFYMMQAIFAYKEAIMQEIERVNLEKLRASKATTMIAELKYTPNNEYTNNAKELTKRIRTIITESVEESR